MIEVRSFRRVFELERRIYRIDRLRLNPGGIPVRGAVYTLVAMAACFVVRGLPIIGNASAAAPWYLRDGALPLALGTVLSVLTIEGRPFHLAAPALVRPLWVGGRHRGLHVGRPQRRWSPGSVVLLPDGSDGRLRRLRYDGPGAVLVAAAHHRRDARRFTLRGTRPLLELVPRIPASEARREVVWMEDGVRMEIASRSPDSAA